MVNVEKTERYSVLVIIVIWGTLWGIFEATVGYLLHSVAFGYSWIIWYPAACFFMAAVYRETGRISSILYIGLLCAAIKMLNLILPGRIDRVINPAISIVFEALAMSVVVFVTRRLSGVKHKNPIIKALVAFSMNMGWRLLYVLYLLFLVPDWIKDISVVSSTSKFIPFFITQNLITTALIFIGYQFMSYIFRPFERIETVLSNRFDKLPRRAVPILQTTMAVLLLSVNVVLQFMLK